MSELLNLLSSLFQDSLLHFLNKSLSRSDRQAFGPYLDRRSLERDFVKENVDKSPERRSQCLTGSIVSVCPLQELFLSSESCCSSQEFPRQTRWNHQRLLRKGKWKIRTHKKTTEKTAGTRRSINRQRELVFFWSSRFHG